MVSPGKLLVNPPQTSQMKEFQQVVSHSIIGGKAKCQVNDLEAL